MGPSPVFLKRLDGKHTVYRITEELSNDIPLGTVVLGINGLSVDSFNRVSLYNFLKNTVLNYSLKTPSGKTYTKEVTTIIGKSFPKWVSEPSIEPEQQKIFDVRFLDKQIYYVQLNTFNSRSIVKKFDSVLPQIQKAKALIIDVRENGGGNSDYARKIAEHLVDRNYTVGSAWQSKVHRSSNKAWGSRILNRSTEPEVLENQAYFKDSAWEYHPGDTVAIAPSTVKLKMPIIVLMGPNTFSAAEDFLVFLDGSKNITTMGRPSAGSSGQPLFLTLPHGLTARICAKRDTYPDGREFINVGIKPNVIIAKKTGKSNGTKDYELQEAVDYVNKGQ